MYGLPPARPAMLFFLSVLCLPVFSDDSGSPKTEPPPVDVSYADNFTVVTRYNLSRYENNHYQGHLYREVRGRFQKNAGNGPQRVFEGSYEVLEQTQRDMKDVARRLDRSYKVTLTVFPDGSQHGLETLPVPFLRDFPRLPQHSLQPGETWEAESTVSVDPQWNGHNTLVPVLALYRYEGAVNFYGADALKITAQFAVRYRSAGRPDTPDSITGTHKVTILIDADTARLIFMTDSFDDTYSLSEKRNLRFRGFAQTWFKGFKPLPVKESADNMRAELAKSGITDVNVLPSGNAVKLDIQKIHFLPDQAVIVPDEQGRLNAVARALKTQPGATFRVVGHTAAVGSAASQYQLSVERAQAVVSELAARGIAAGRFVYEGKGSSEPVGDNATESGREKNRRVEIYVQPGE